MSSSNNYDVIPITNKCGASNNIKIELQPGSKSDMSQKIVDNNSNQQILDSQYDTASDLKVTPMYGGKKKSIKICAKNEKNAIEKLISEKKYKKVYNIEVTNNKNKSLYLYLPKENKSINKFYVTFKNKISEQYAKNEKDAIKQTINGKTYKKDYLIGVTDSNKKNTQYILVSNKLKKLV